MGNTCRTAAVANEAPAKCSDTGPQDDFRHSGMTAAQLETLLSMSQEIIHAHTRRTANERILHHACAVVGADRVSFFSVDHINKSLKLLVSKGLHHQVTQSPSDAVSFAENAGDQHNLVHKLHLPLDRKSLAGACAMDNCVVNLPDAYTDARFSRLTDQATGYRTRSVVCVPIVTGKGVVGGVLQALNKTDGRAFSEMDVNLLQRIGGFAATALNNVALLEDAERARDDARTAQKETEALMRMSESLYMESSTSTVVSRLVESSYRLLDVERITFYLVNREASWLEIAESKDSALVGARIPIDQGIAGHVAAHGETMIIDDAYADPRFDQSIDQHTGFETRNILCMPVKDATGQVVAVIQAINKAKLAHFAQADVKRFEVLATSAGLTLRKAQLYSSAVQAQATSEAMLKVLKTLSREYVEVRELISEIIAAAYPMLMCERMTLHLIDRQRSELWIAVSKFENQGIRTPIGTGIPGWVAQHAQTVNVMDAPADERFDDAIDQRTQFSTRSVLCMPVRAAGGVVAVFEASNKVGAPGFSHQDEVALHAFSAEVGRALVRNAVGTQLHYSSGNPNAIERSLFENFAVVSVPPSPALGRRGMTQKFTFDMAGQADVRRWDLDILGSPAQTQRAVAVTMLNEAVVAPGVFNIESGMLTKFVDHVCRSYQQNPFHGFAHGVDCMHTVFMMLGAGVGERLHGIDVLTLMIASLCHDVDHPGFTNAFEIARATRPQAQGGIVPDALAVIHNDDGVLERHHATTTFRLLSDPEVNLLGGLDESELRWARRGIIRSILATDMARHFDHMQELEGRVVAVVDEHQELNPDDDNDRLFLMRTLVHAADLGAQTLPQALAHAWGERVLAEFHAQYEKEGELGLPQTVFMAGLDDPLTKAKVQLGFVVNIVVPLWVGVARIWPRLQDCVDRLEHNRRGYQAEVDALSAAAASE